VPEQRHEGLQRHAGVGKGSRVGVAQLVGGHDQHLSAGAVQPGVLGGGQEPVAQPRGAEAVAVLGEEEVGGPAGPRMGHGSVPPAGRGPFVQGGERVVVEGDHAFGGELADRDTQPGPGSGVVDDGVELEVEQLPDAQTRAAQHGQTGAGERIAQSGDSAHQRGVDVGREGAGQGTVELGDVGGEDESAGRCLVPAPRR